MQECLFDEGANEDVWNNVNKYRQLECFVFYAQIVSIFVYLLFSRGFIWLKHWFDSSNDKDPFQNLMISSEEDFLGNNNIIL